MADAADDACIHPIRDVQRNEQQKTIEHVCLDCGRASSSISDEAVARQGPAALRTWAARSGIPERKIERFIRTFERPLSEMTDYEIGDRVLDARDGQEYIVTGKASA